MSDQMHLTLNYRTKLVADSLQAVVCSVQRAVAINWQRFQCLGCMPRPGFDDSLEKWVEDILSNKMHDVRDLAEEDEEDHPEYISDAIFITFSPCSSRALLMWISVNSNKNMGVHLQIDSDVKSFDPVFSNFSNVKHSWDTNKYCLENIVNFLIDCLPTRKVLVEGLSD